MNDRSFLRRTTRVGPTVSRARSVVALMGFLALPGCDGGSGPPPPPDALQAVAGTDQQATVGSAVPEAPAVRVLNRKGKPLRGREVVFSVGSGGGQLSGATAETGKDGIARVGAWVLGTTAGTQTLEARVEGVGPLVFSAAALAGPPTGLSTHGGDDQTGIVGSTLPLNPSVLVEDSHGNPVPGAEVRFEITGGGGFLAAYVGTTDASGVGEAEHWTLGNKPGFNTLSASVSGVPPVTLRATAVADVPNRLTVLLGDGQTGVVGTPLPLVPTVLVADRFGNLLEGISVQFEAAPGSGIVAGGQKVTDSNGVAFSGAWTLGEAAGTQSLGISVPGLDPVSIFATAEAGPPVSASRLGPDSLAATVGAPVPQAPRVRVEDRFGNPVAGVPVAFFTSGSPDPQNSPGSVEGAEAVTGADGSAGAGGWVLGTRAGWYRLTGLVQGLGDETPFHALAVPGEPDSLTVHGGQDQTGRIGDPVPQPPSVRVSDRYGNGVEGVQVTFSVLEGGGDVEGAEQVTDAEGIAVLGAWSLGPVPGVNRLSASAEGLEAVAFDAVGITAIPASLVRVVGNGQTATVGSAVKVPPQVRVADAEGDPVPFVEVVFSVVSGGGSVLGEVALTDAAGLASVGAWVLGTVAGGNTLSASTGSLGPVLFSAVGRPGPPTTMAVAEGDGQIALPNTAVRIPPSVVVRDSFGNPVSGIPVSFFVSTGGGSVQGGEVSTGGDGVAAVTAWILGPDAGLNGLTATSPGLADAHFTATVVDGGEFDVELQFMTAVDPTITAVFQDAVARWELILVGDLPDYSGSLPEGGCQPVSESNGVDDVKVYVTVEAIDGVGGVLGRAGPCYYRTDGGVFPITGIMELDEADLADMYADGLLEDVIIHELGHVLGFGTLWNSSTNDFLEGAGTLDPYFTGSEARAAFDEAGGASRTDPKVPVENTGGAGTRDGHWRESVHNSELMTGWIESSGGNPLSAITVGSFADMGYLVNPGAADPYVLFNPLGAPGQEPEGERIFLLELPPPVPIPAGSGG